MPGDHTAETGAAHGANGHRVGVYLAAATAGILLAATILLWAQYGSAVFFEMVLAGIAACF